jgi:hypothetical protein
VQEALLVGVFNRVAYLVHVLDHLLDAHQRIGPGVLLEGPAGHVFHHQAAEFIGRARLEHLDDVRVPQLAGEARLVHPHLAHAVADFRVLEPLQIRQLDRHLPLPFVLDQTAAAQPSVA